MQLKTFTENKQIFLRNDSSEPMQRMKNLIQSNANFLSSLLGRSALDVIHIIMQMASGAHVGIRLTA